MPGVDVDDLRARRELLHGHLAEVRAADLVLRRRDEEGRLRDARVLLGEFCHRIGEGSVSII